MWLTQKAIKKLHIFSVSLFPARVTHADFAQTKEFIEALDPKHIILVHGEKHEAERLKKE